MRVSGALDIAVVGGGNGSYTMAADFVLAGHRVRMYPGSRDKHSALYERGAIDLTGIGRTGTAQLQLVSEELGAVVAGAQVVCSTDPASSQPARAALLAPYLEDRQLVLLSPGSLGSYLFATTVRSRGCRARLTFAEPATLPYLTRKTGQTRVNVSGRAVHLPVGIFPARETAALFPTVRALFPAAEPVEDVLSVATLNSGPIIHSVLFLLNTGPIESLEAWDIHNEGSSPSVKRLVLLHDEERIRLREALGYTSKHYPFADHWSSEREEWMYGRMSHTNLVKSTQWREKLDLGHRYIVEDVKCNLALLQTVGDVAGCETPVMDSILTLIGGLTGEDYAQSGRTLASLGLGGMSLAQLQALLQGGMPAAAATIVMS